MNQTTAVEAAKKTTLLDIANTLRELERQLESLEVPFEAGKEAIVESQAEQDAIITGWLLEVKEETQAVMLEKIDHYAALISEIEGRAAIRQLEAERLEGLANCDQAKADRLKARLHWFLTEYGFDRVETPRYRLSVVKNGGKRPMTVNTNIPLEAIPEAFLRTVKTVNLEAVRAELEAGKSIGVQIGSEVLPLASLGDRQTHLRIR